MKTFLTPFINVFYTFLLIF